MSKKLILNIDNLEILAKLRQLREAGVNITELICDAILDYEECDEEDAA